MFLESAAIGASAIGFKIFLKSLFVVLIDVRILRVTQGLSLNRFSFLDIIVARVRAYQGWGVELNTVVKIKTSWLTLVSSVGFKVLTDYCPVQLKIV